MVNDFTRATDSDRNDTCQVLDAALEDGQLSTEEHRERVSAATKATTLGELRSLVADLQTHPAAGALPTTGSRARARGIWIAAAVTLVVIVATVAWVLQRPTVSTPSVSSTTTAATTGKRHWFGGGRNEYDTTTTATTGTAASFSGVTGVLAQMRTQFGDTLGYQLNIYQDQAVVERPDTANAQKIVIWLYRSGNWANVGPKMAVSPGLAVGDLSKFDVQAVLGVVQQAPQTLHIYDANQLYLTIESRKDGSLNMRIHVSDGALGGFITVAPDGAVTEVSPPAR